MRIEFSSQTACCDNLAFLKVFAVTCIDNHFLIPDAVVLFHEVALVDNLLFEEVGVACVEDFDLAHHLAYDNLEVLVVDFHTLHTVNVLYFVHDIFLNSCRAHDIEDIGGRDSAVGEGSACTDDIVLLHENLLRQRYEVLLVFAECGYDGDFAVTTLDLAEFDLTVDFGDDGGVRWVACLEELGDTGKTAGDIAGTACGAGDFCESLTGFDFVAFLEDEVSAHGEGVCCEGFAGLAENVDRRHVLTVARLDDYAVLGH